MIEWYLSTLIDYALAAAGIALAMFLTYQLLPRLGVKRETATGFALIMPWLLGFLIWTPTRSWLRSTTALPTTTSSRRQTGSGWTTMPAS